MNEIQKNEAVHKPVLLNEILEHLNPQAGDSFIDGTANGGGHTFAFWEKVRPDGKILAVDKDCGLVESLELKAQNQGVNIIAVCDSYANLKNIVGQQDFGSASGVLLDLGYSSYHIDLSGRGFSFQKDEPLNMRYDKDLSLGSGLTAADVVNSFPENELADIIYKYGEERLSRRIAKEIVLSRRRKKIETTKELAEIVERAYPKKFFRKVSPATKTFQALRIFVNQELEDLEKFLPQVSDILKPKGRIAIISFHSLEDRIVKNFFRDNKDKFEIVTKKPIIPTREEVLENPRARSAKLRVAIKK